MKKMERLGVEAAEVMGDDKASYDTPAEEVEKVAEEARSLDFRSGCLDKPIVTLEDVSFATRCSPRRSNNDDGDTELDDDVDMNEDYRPVGASSATDPPLVNHRQLHRPLTCSKHHPYCVT